MTLLYLTFICSFVFQLVSWESPGAFGLNGHNLVSDCSWFFPCFVLPPFVELAHHVAWHIHRMTSSFGFP